MPHHIFFTLLFLAILIFSPQAAYSETKDKSTFTVQVRDSMSHQEIRERAEQLTNNYISSVFFQNSDVQEVHINVLGEKFIEIVPLFVISVTRSQWQESPHIRDWVSYNQASFSLLQTRQTIASSGEEIDTISSPSRPVVSSQIDQSSISRSELNQFIDVSNRTDQFTKEINPQVFLDDLD